MEEKVTKSKEEIAIEAESKQRHLENLKRESKVMNELIPIMKHKEKLLEEKMSIDKKAWECMKKGFVVTNPIWAYESDQEYLNLVKRIKEINLEFKAYSEEDQLTTLTRQRESQVTQLSSIDKEIERLEEEMKNE